MELATNHTGGLRGVFGRVGSYIGLHRGLRKPSDWLGRLLPGPRRSGGILCTYTSQHLRLGFPAATKELEWARSFMLGQRDLSVMASRGIIGDRTDYAFGRPRPRATGGRHAPAVLLVPSSLAGA